MKTLVQRAIKKDAECFIRLMEENKQSMLKVAYGFFSNEEDVADVMQQTVLDAYEHIGELKKAAYFKTWLIRILINNCNQLEQKIRHTINETVLESELVSQKMQEAYDKIRKMQKTRKRKVSLAVRFGTVAAVLAVATIYCVKNPAIAAQIPFLGNIFRDLEGQVSFPGDYSEKSIKLGAASEEKDHPQKQDASDDRNDAGQTVPMEETAYGVTVTLSEAACDYNSIYLALLVQNEKGFSKDATYPNILFYDAKVKLQKQDGSIDKFEYETEGIYTVGIEGEYIDAHTFQGIYQFGTADLDLSEYTACDLTFTEFEQLLPTGGTETITVPDYGEVTRLIPDSVHYKGPWKFHLNLEDMEVNEQEIPVQEANENGFGIEKVVKTEFAIYAVPILPEGEKEYDYVATIWDADGEPLDDRDFGQYLTMSHYGRDISSVTVYLLKMQDFLDHKGENSYLQPEKAVYQKTVRLDD